MNRRDFIDQSVAAPFTDCSSQGISKPSDDLNVGACGDEKSTSLTVRQQLALTSIEAIAAISNGSLSAVSYVTTLITCAKENSSLNAMIYLDESGALSAAALLDSKRAAGESLPLLAGLPIVVKDNINTKDMKTTGATPALRNFQPTRNAPSLQKLIDAGAIVLGKSNMHEMALGVTSTNFTLGVDAVGIASRPAQNPYNTLHVPGGSSGGTASAIAAGFAPCGLGTDTGGSSRVPAAFCGIVGLRPSVGDGLGKGRRYVDGDGVIPVSHTRDTVGPMGRSVADVALLDAVITDTAMPTAKSLKGVRMGIPASFWSGLDASLSVVAMAARQKLVDAGAIMVDVDIEGIIALNDKISFPIALHEPLVDIPNYLAANGADNITVQSIANQIASPDVRDIFGAIMADALGGEYLDAINLHRPTLQAMYREYFSVNRLDVILFPTVIITAPTIDAINGSSQNVTVNGSLLPGRNEFSAIIRNTDPSSNAGIPGLSIPAGLTTAGLPVGLEIDGPLGSDQMLLAIGMSMEAVIGRLSMPAI
jgi:Asp-tRNA(Asn)/Glu-tRNA(Gln) amidotransferase A subunit family amidase